MSKEGFGGQGPQPKVQGNPQTETLAPAASASSAPAVGQTKRARLLSSEHDRQLPVILAIDDVPELGDLAYLGEFGTLSAATLQIDEKDTISATAIRFGRREALALAVRLTELLGPMDTTDLESRSRLEPGRDPADD